jgi:hypothetical protein
MAPLEGNNLLEKGMAPLDKPHTQIDFDKDIYLAKKCSLYACLP